jgi:NAD(P)-dependent dehydrogenase (short-subunit alcohol dehydrogenase family)
VPDEELTGRTVVLVGVGAGGDVLSNGRATALAFARAGARLVLMDRSGEALAECARQVEQVGAEHVESVLDATAEDEVRAAVAAAVQTFGRIDVLHNNLGITQYGHLPRTSVEDFHRVMDVNVKSLYLLSREVAPLMREQGSGVITNVSSIASGRYLGIASPLYDMSKAAVNALTRYLAAAYGPFGVRANALLLGMMDTPMARSGVARGTRALDDVYEEYAARIPAGRLGTGEDCAGVAVFLASDRAAYVNGMEFPIDGGLAVTTA